MRGIQPWLTNRARVLRDGSTSSEAALWRRLRNRQLGGFKFVRQEPIGSYFVDFVCRSQKLVIEVDGATHAGENEMRSDAERTAYLENLGFRVLRFCNNDLLENMSGVLDMVWDALASHEGPEHGSKKPPLTPTLSPQAGRGRRE